MGQVELLHGAGHADVAEAAFLFEFFRATCGAAVREEVLFHADHEDQRELEAFGGMQGHQGHPVEALVVRVEIGNQRDLLQVILQGAFFGEVLFHARQQLLQVVHAVTCFFGFLARSSGP